MDLAVGSVKNGSVNRRGIYGGGDHWNRNSIERVRFSYLSQIAFVYLVTLLCGGSAIAVPHDHVEFRMRELLLHSSLFWQGSQCSFTHPDARGERLFRTNSATGGVHPPVRRHLR